MSDEVLELPKFRFHSNLERTGAIERRSVLCTSCELERSHVYIGPVFGTDLPESLCPWCIASGDAARRFNVCFVDPHVDPQDGDKTVPSESVVELSKRTPGYLS